MGWLDRLFDPEHRRWGRHGDTADMAARASIVASSREDQARARARLEATPLPPVRWRWWDGRWQRWSELDVGFVDAEPPDGLVAHVGARPRAVEGHEMAFVDGAWTDLDAEAPPTGPVPPGQAPAAGATDRPPPPPPPPPGPVAQTEEATPTESPEPDPAEAAASFEEQLERWRRRPR